MNYLYNGKELPKIPVVEGLDFSFIDNEGLGFYGLYLTPNLPVVKQLPTGYGDSTGDFLCNIMGGQYWRYVPDVNSWVFDSNIEADEAPIWTLGQGIWSNHNVYNEDGTLYLAASEPVPIVPTPPSAQTAFCIGKAFGRLIRDSISDQST